MDTEKMMDHSNDSKAAMQNCEKRSNNENASNGQESLAKRTKNVSTGADCDEKFEIEIHVPNDVDMLKSLLSKKASNLTELNISFRLDFNCSETQLVHAHLFEEFEAFDLPKLNVLRVFHMDKKDYGIVSDVLKAASNLSSFEKVGKDHDDGSLHPRSIEADELSMLQSANKLHCLKRVSLSFDETLAEFLKKSPLLENLPFESIILSLNKLFAPYTSDDVEMINKIFWASKNSLLELTVTPIGSLPGIELPRFENLKKLVLCHDDVLDGRSMFPKSFDMVNSFPSLQELVVDILMYDDYFSSYRPSSVMSNVEHLTIVGDCKYDELLMKMTPNVKTLVFDGEDDELPDMNFTAIAKHLTKLETLKWEFHVESPDELLSSCELDAMITGFTDQFCKTLSIQLRNVDHLSARKIASYEKKRQYSSLVDLKGLKQLDIMLNMRCSDSDDDYVDCEDDDDENEDDDAKNVADAKNDTETKKDVDAKNDVDVKNDGDAENDVDVNNDAVDEYYDLDDYDDECSDVAGFQRDSPFYNTGLTKIEVRKLFTKFRVTYPYGSSNSFCSQTSQTMANCSPDPFDLFENISELF